MNFEEKKDELVIEEIKENVEEVKENVEGVKENLEEVKDNTIDKETKEKKKSKKVEKKQEDTSKEKDTEDDEIEDEEDVELDPSVMYSPNMLFKLKLATDFIQKYYNDLRNEILSYSNIKFRSHSSGDVYLLKGKIILRVTVFPNVVKVYYGLSLKSLDAKKYHLRDASKVAKYENVPALLRVGSDRAYKYALEILESLMKKNNVSKKQKVSNVDYIKDFATNSQELLELQGGKELLRNTCSKDTSSDLNDKLAKNCITREADTVNYETKKTAEITIGELSAAFRAHSTIDLQLLRDTELVESDVNFVKVIALGKCSKPLTVKANDFDMEVVKMIILTGGNVIKIV